MKKIVLFLVSIPYILLSQDDKDIYTKLYKRGLEAFKQEKYKEADSLFSLSIKEKPHPDAFYNKALCRGKLADQKGMCENLLQAAKYHDDGSIKAFCKFCGKADTTYLDALQKPSTKEFGRFTNITLTSQHTQSLEIQLDNQHVLMPATKPGFKSGEVAITNKNSSSDGNSSVSEVVEEPAMYPGGLAEMAKFINKNIKFPQKIKEEKVSGKVFSKFIVYEDGHIDDVIIVKNIPGCDECSEETIRLIKSMPKWTPAKMSGRAVKCYFNLPVSFKAR